MDNLIGLKIYISIVLEYTVEMTYSTVLQAGIKNNH